MEQLVKDLNWIFRSKIIRIWNHLFYRFLNKKLTILVKILSAHEHLWDSPIHHTKSLGVQLICGPLESLNLFKTFIVWRHSFFPLILVLINREPILVYTFSFGQQTLYRNLQHYPVFNEARLSLELEHPAYLGLVHFTFGLFAGSNRTKTNLLYMCAWGGLISRWAVLVTLN